MSMYKERAKWYKIGGITLLIILVITELIIWSGILDSLIFNKTHQDGKLGVSAIAFAVFGGMGAPLLFRARLYSFLAKKENKNE